MATEVSGFLNIFNTSAQRLIKPILQDGIFYNDPLPAILKRDCLERYDGGLGWQLNFAYDTLPVYDIPRGGASWDLTASNKQLSTGCNFDIRSKVVPVVADFGQLTAEIWPSSPQVKLDRIEELLEHAALVMSAKIAVDLYKHGQNLTADRSLALNGLDEYLNDGATNGFETQTFTSYGTVTRSSVGNALNSPMTAAAGVVAADQSAAPLSRGVLEDAWNSVVVGNVMPKFLMTTNKGASIIKKLIFPYERHEMGKDPDFGFTTFQFNGVPVYQSQYAPGTRPLTTNADTQAGYVAYGAGETIWFLNQDYLYLYISSHPAKSFALTDFVPSQNNQILAAQYLADLNFCGKPGAARFMRYLFGVN